MPNAVEPTSISSEILAAFEKKGYSATRWNREASRPFLLTWKGVKNWEDCKHWLGFGLPRKHALREGTSYVIFSNLGVHLKNFNLGNLPKDRLILFTWEPPAVQSEIWDAEIQKYFHKIYTWHDDLVDNVRFFKFSLPYLSERIERLIPYEERKFLTCIASRLSSKHPHELYSEREKVIRFFEARPDVEFDLYGRYWEKRKFRTWKGVISDKMEVLKYYRFAIAYENSVEPGYITEKLWDCFAAGVVPIYWGAPNIVDYVPLDCFIDRKKFHSDEELLLYLQNMKKQEWEGYVERANAFLQSEKAERFKFVEYVRTLTNAV
ncbi:MAG TPA: glycosyltransferase family 10 [Chlamydiales bacterium]|nr:glycosyltransferase family 10 [Chlamydiales bacterium]